MNSPIRNVLIGRRAAAWLMLFASLAPFQWCEAAGPEPPPDAMLSDASLLDVCFVSPTHGWAVGERGVIWATRDGGRAWHRQVSPVHCTLHSVHFINERTGWAVGGWIHPHTHRSTGVVLRTRDGGQRWLITPGLSLPKLARVKFFDDQNGWALGDSSTLFPTGLFRTTNAGRNWKTVPSGHSNALVTGDFVDNQVGAAAGRFGELLVVRGAKLGNSQTADLGQRTLHALRLDGPDGWLAGDGGLLMNTADGGRNWRLAGPPGMQAEQFDFHTVSMFQQQAWVAGSPGSMVFHTLDRGKTWRALRTGQSAPLRSLHFIDAMTGWAVGDLGRILHTRNGGQTWSVQRHGGARAALLGLFSSEDDIPWELLARYAGDEGYLTAIQTIGRRDWGRRSDQDAASLPDRIAEGLTACGGCRADIGAGFPLRERGVDLGGEALQQLWRNVHDDDPMRVLEEVMVRRIRQWQPDVVVASKGQSPLERIVARAAVNAVQAASDPTAHSLQLTAAALKPWRVKKLFLVDAVDKVTSSPDKVFILPSQLAARLGTSVGEVASQGRAMVTTKPQRSQPCQLTLTHATLPRDIAARELFQGISLRPGSEARRELQSPQVPLDVLTKRAQLTRNAEAFADQTLRSGRADQWVAGLSDLTTDLPVSGAGALLYELSETFRRQGRLDLAADVLERMVHEYPSHRLSESAMLRLIRYYSSSEDAWRRQSATFFTQQTTAHERILKQAPARATDIPTFDARQNRILTPVQTKVGAAVTAAGHLSPNSRRRKAAKLAEWMRQQWPHLNSDPQVRFALSAVERVEGAPSEVGAFYRSMMSQSNQGNPWAVRAGVELWLKGGMKGQPTLPISHCLQGPKPYLDGKLTDTIWQQAAHLDLRTPHHDDGQWPAATMVAWDLEYLYLAVRCQSPIDAGAATKPTALKSPRRRDDSTMAQRDRVTVRIDVDRDYATAFEWSIDHRGWGGERCLGDPTWNPPWHIAHHAEKDGWAVEAAIPWSTMRSAPPKSGEAWAVDIHRVVPGHGIQSWTKEATSEIRPEGFGLIVFQK